MNPDNEPKPPMVPWFRGVHPVLGQSSFMIIRVDSGHRPLRWSECINQPSQQMLSRIVRRCGRCGGKRRLGRRRSPGHDPVGPYLGRLVSPNTLANQLTHISPADLGACMCIYYCMCAFFLHLEGGSFFQIFTEPVWLLLWLKVVCLEGR